ncbi:hypothetical protein RHSIM_RhsimUnG0142100 [Rhododendron simsii]|uniref:Uncharacterized protein n=1 Tax=Rhododendron simsii TaxID=118357 RepID=A0A834L4N1_RHOSS|nr:hypothetical protein RHSIM_RhsimUnG0142100 [Rhododendron simsii]
MATSSFLGNKYWVLRHGKSIPNEMGLIVSSMENGTLEEYSLAPEGVNQAQLAGELFQKVDSNKGMSYGNKEVVEDLHERFFGPSLELSSHDMVCNAFKELKYSVIWALDEKNSFVKPEGGESVSDVVSRLTKALITIESAFQGCTILVVSHGDPLQILQTILHAAKEHDGPSCDLASRIEAVKVPSVLSQHRKYALLTGELRAVI